MASLSTQEFAFGIKYVPASAKLPTLGRDDFPHVLHRLRGHGIRYIRLQWVDYTNITRHRIIPLSAFTELLGTSRPGVGVTTAVLGLVALSLAPGFTGTGEYLYTPDLSSIRVCGYAPGHASLMGWFEEKLPVQNQFGKDSLEVPLCPRGLLRNIVNKGHSLGVEFLVGCETEFILLKATNPIEAVNDAPWSASCALPSGSDEAKCLEEIADALQIGEIELLMYHGEAAPGQYEIVAGPLPPLEAADAVVFTRETIVNIATKHGLRATFAPRIFTKSAGNGVHFHISTHPTAQPPANPPPANPNTNEETTMTPLERSFLQALLKHLPSSTAFMLPTAASYDRVQDHICSCGTYACWGVDNKEVAVRLAGVPGYHRFEVRTVDGTANPYIALATILGLGLVGVQEGSELQMGAIVGQAAALSDEERAKKGIVNRLPSTLGAARDAARKDATICDVLGQEFVEKYLSVNETMEKYMESGNAEENRIKSMLTY